VFIMDGEFVLHRRQVPNIQDEATKIVELADVGRGWTFLSSTGNVNCYFQKNDRSPFHLVLGEGIVHTTTDNLSQFLHGANNATEFDPTLIEREEIVKVTDTSRVMRLRYQYPALMSNREFVIHAYDAIISENPKIAISAGISVEHEMCKEDPEFVRGIILVSGYVCKEITLNPPRTHVSFVVQLDPKGWLPPMVGNMIAAEQALNVVRLKQYFEQPAALHKTEQTYKFPKQLIQTIDNAQSEGSESSETSSATENANIVWHDENLADDVRTPVYTNTSSDDTESKETLLDQTGPIPASKLLQFFSLS